MGFKLTSKGQVTVPKNVRDYLGLKPGDPVTFERLPNGEVALRHVHRRGNRPASRFAKLRGRATVRMTTEGLAATMKALLTRQ